MQIKLSPTLVAVKTYQEIAVPVGQYTDYEVLPTCGLATTTGMIGDYDNPACFMDPARVNAGILWFSRGFVEYKVPNYTRKGQQLKEIEISMEIGSEAPKVNENWSSDICFTFNNNIVGVWTSPGDFGKHRGRLTPDWWHSDVNQYGVRRFCALMRGEVISTASSFRM